MLLFIEGFPYPLDHVVRDGLTIKNILEGVVSFPKLESTYSPEYVGYCFSKKAKDVVFFLPKVVLTGERDENNEHDTIFGASPLDIIDFEDDRIKTKFTEEGHKDYKEFLSTLSIWIYRTIQVYKQTNNVNILENREHQTESRGKKQKHNTLLDVIIALRDFNKNNQDYFTFIAKNLHSGHNKIQWVKTITHTQAIVQNGRPIYTAPVNKKKVVNFDEELLIIYFSILNYISDIHGFSFNINLQYDLISPDHLKRKYIAKNFGCKRLKQIKYKYFSDKALRIWDLCYAFFDREYKIAMNQIDTDYLLAKDFDHIFEVMIDSLIGGSDKQALPEELTRQKDGKMVDHMFIGQGLIEQTEIPSELTYYIGDSKYYKRTRDDRTHLGDTSIYKQYTYARNVIQWNMNLFLDDESNDQPQLRDTLTEGYNPIPNFFISARIPHKREDEKYLSFDDGTLRTQEGAIQVNRQFENRLFDRDTLLLCHYDVNFLFIVSLYGRANKSKQSAWREYVRQEFRTRIQTTLNGLYDFHILQPRLSMDCYRFIQDNFHQLNGKLYRPHNDSNYLVLALLKKDGVDLWNKILARTRTNKASHYKNVVDNVLTTNDDLLESLRTHFHVSDSIKLDKELSIPETDNIGSLEPHTGKNNGVLMVMMENFEGKSKNFTPTGLIAIGIKDTDEGRTILDNVGNIRYILFHTRSNINNNHLFRVLSTQEVNKGYVLRNDIYHTPKELDRYVLVNMDSEFELVTTGIKPRNIPYTRNTRYDSQFVMLDELK